MRAAAVSAAERDALHDLILDRLSGIDDLGLAISRKDYRRAEYLAGLYSDYLTLVLLDLHWTEAGPSVEKFSTPLEIVERVLGRLRLAAESPQGFLEKDRVAAEELESRNRLVLGVCSRVLGTSEQAASK